MRTFVLGASPALKPLLGKTQADVQVRRDSLGVRARKSP